MKFTAAGDAIIQTRIPTIAEYLADMCAPYGTRAKRSDHLRVGIKPI